MNSAFADYGLFLESIVNNSKKTVLVVCDYNKKEVIRTSIVPELNGKPSHKKMGQKFVPYTGYNLLCSINHHFKGEYKIRNPEITTINLTGVDNPNNYMQVGVYPIEEGGWLTMVINKNETFYFAAGKG